MMINIMESRRQNKLIMHKITPSSVPRSFTNQQLPTLTLKTPRSRPLPPHPTHLSTKSYLNELSKQLTGNVEYDQLDNLHLNLEQQKLKNMLKKINDDTVRIIADYTPRRARARGKAYVRTVSSILAVREKEMENNYQILQQCQIQIQKLKQKSQQILQQSASSPQSQQLQSLQYQILHLRQQTKLLCLQNQKRGKKIVTETRIIEQGQIRKLETDVYLAEHRAVRLREEDSRVGQEIGELRRKLAEIEPRFGEAEGFFKTAGGVERGNKGKGNKNGKGIMDIGEELANKKEMLESMKKKVEFYNQNYQYKYLNLLRQLDSIKSSSTGLQTKLDKNFISIQASKMIINKLQSQLRALKMKKKQKQSNIRNFLNSNTTGKIRKEQGQEDGGEKDSRGFGRNYGESSGIGERVRKMETGEKDKDREEDGDGDGEGSEEGDLENALAGFIGNRMQQEEVKQVDSNRIKQINQEHREDTILK